jgi:hypothetical protein
MGTGWFCTSTCELRAAATKFMTAVESFVAAVPNRAVGDRARVDDKRYDGRRTVCRRSGHRLKGSEH